MLFDKIGAETVVTCGHRRVRGENHFARDSGTACMEADAFFLHAHANRLQHSESAVAFVQMQNAGRDAHGLQSAQAAHAQQQFLADARCGRSPP